jgi:hypothetical protein
MKIIKFARWWWWWRRRRRNDFRFVYRHCEIVEIWIFSAAGRCLFFIFIIYVVYLWNYIYNKSINKLFPRSLVIREICRKVRLRIIIIIIIVIKGMYHQYKRFSAKYKWSSIIVLFRCKPFREMNYFHPQDCSLATESIWFGCPTAIDCEPYVHHLFQNLKEVK